MMNEHHTNVSAEQPDRVVDWTEHERALWRTCEILVGLGRTGRWPDPIPTAFARQISSDEHVVAWSEFERGWYGAIGDGSYQSSTFVAGGFSPLGVMLGAATLGASALGNSSRKARARKDAQQQWRRFDGGHLYVSTHGFYLLPGGVEVLAFPYSSILQADLGAPGVLVATISMASGGQEQFAVTTIWAELLFAVWAMDHCPQHPRLASLGFLPREFVERVAYAGVWDTSPLRELGAGA
jgi:hypothetical protein